ncbi:uncharacterized protein LOC127803867 [Diospyros lotus]|uniref:uncharacterized protein LOC127803867 n=1 Tax=Diospyros lotus TaxID=55363 RepID=UPI00224FE0A8|nr:uncharacterized protein LOC127803867 [Diospyros lotus]XP_052196426.1 uncharacterized protein LOC127803867 [Diospyros lotus]
MSKKTQMGRHGEGSATRSYMDFMGQKMDIKSIMKDIEFLGSSHMTWKERKELENRKVAALGGKPPKRQRLPLSVARIPMKKQKEREQKMREESLILGRFGGKLATCSKKATEKLKPEDKVLKPTEGRFRNGVLDVKHLLQPAGPRKNDGTGYVAYNKGKKKRNNTKNQGKKKGGKRKRH